MNMKVTATITGFLGFSGNVQEFYTSTLNEALARIQNYTDGYVCKVEHSVIVECWNKEGDKVEIHSFGHWACGWYDLILVHPDLKEDLEKIEKRLSDYPLLNEDEYSNRVFNEACDYWAEASIRTRIEICKDNNISIFASRSDCLPEDVDVYSLIGE